MVYFIIIKRIREEITSCQRSGGLYAHIHILHHQNMAIFKRPISLVDAFCCFVKPHRSPECSKHFSLLLFLCFKGTEF